MTHVFFSFSSVTWLIWWVVFWDYVTIICVYNKSIINGDMITCGYTAYNSAMTELIKVEMRLH